MNRCKRQNLEWSGFILAEIPGGICVRHFEMSSERISDFHLNDTLTFFFRTTFT